jgi:hypothetical protein
VPFFNAHFLIALTFVSIDVWFGCSGFAFLYWAARTLALVIIAYCWRILLIQSPLATPGRKMDTDITSRTQLSGSAAQRAAWAPSFWKWSATRTASETAPSTALRASPLGGLYRPENLVNRNAGAGNNWAKATTTQGLGAYST